MGRRRWPVTELETTADLAAPLGRIAWVEQLNPARGRRLRERFAEITWPAR